VIRLSDAPSLGGIRDQRPGLFLLLPFVQQMVRVDLRVAVDEVPPQDVISRDNVSVKVSAVIYFRVSTPRSGANWLVVAR
jgi:regulator of protease activity HflC (stomatin/prohibitin superfamily)